MADFYGTAAGYEAYLLARNYPPTDATDAEIEAALLVASEWLDARYGPMLAAGCTNKTGGRAQVREWPRAGFVDVYGYAIGQTEIPREVEHATYEATLRQLANPGSLSVDYTPSKYKRAAVDGAVSVEYAGYSSAYDLQTSIPIIDGIMYPLISSQTGANLSGLSGKAVRV